MNAGIYVLQRDTVAAWSGAPVFSLERDIFPPAVAHGRCYGYPVSGPLTDIGSPERYRAAQHRLR